MPEINVPELIERIDSFYEGRNYQAKSAALLRDCKSVFETLIKEFNIETIDILKQERITTLIPLSLGRFTIIDAEDYDYLSQWKWCSHKTYYYAMRRDYTNGKKSMYRMHRLIMKAKENEYVDHINGNRLDNRKSNLRICNKGENNQNCGLRRNNTSGYKGVSWSKKYKKYNVQININGKRKTVGSYIDPIEAAKAYDEAAFAAYGEFAKTNKMLGLL